MHLTLNGSQINVQQQGVGSRTLILLHYFGGSSLSWQPLCAALGDEVQCVAPDLRGFGNSRATSYDLAAYVADLGALVAALALERYTIVAHSMGGKIALAYAAQHPAGLQSLILLAPSPPTPEPIAAHQRERLLTTHGQRAAAKQTISKIVAHPLPTPLLEQAIADNLRCDPAAWSAWLEVGSREDIAAAVGKLDIPTLVVSGERDQTIPRKLIEQQVMPHLNHAHLEIVPTSGHLLPLEATNEVANLIRAAPVRVYR